MRTVKRRTAEDEDEAPMRRRRMRMGRRRTEKVLYRDEVDEDCEEKDCGE